MSVISAAFVSDFETLWQRMWLIQSGDILRRRFRSPLALTDVPLSTEWFQQRRIYSLSLL